MDSTFKLKYKNKIKELMESLPQESAMDVFVDEMERELTDIKNEKKETLNHYARILKYYVIIADIILLASIGILVLGIYMKTYWDVAVVWPALLITLAALALVASGIFFGLAEYNREARHRYFKEMPSDSDISSLLKLASTARKEYHELYSEREKNDV